MEDETFNRIEYDNNFEYYVRDIIKKYSITDIVETGTNIGRGCKIFAETLLSVDTIECNDYLYNIAKNNLSKYKNVKLHFGYSLTKKQILDRLNDTDYFKNYFNYKKDGVKVDVLETQDPHSFYVEELIKFSSECVEENLLLKCLSNKKSQLVYLDSAGCLGFLEFKKIMTELPLDILLTKTILMDDCNHIKHIESFNYIKSHDMIYNSFLNGRFVCFNLLENKDKL